MPAAPEPPRSRALLPTRFCNLERLLDAMVMRDVDGVVASTPYNVFYLTGFNAIAHKSDEPRPYAVVISRHAPDASVLVVADYYLASFLAQPTWIEDIRPFRAVMLPLDRPADPRDIDRFVPLAGEGVGWVERGRRRYGANIVDSCRGAIADLGLDRGRLACDDLRFGQMLGLEHAEIVDGYDPLMYARQVKTADEIDLLRGATTLNQTAIERTVASWRKGMTWKELNHGYHRAVTELGGFVRDPGGMVWGHPRGADAAAMLQTGLEDFEVEPGMHVMFDCHGTLNLYCWDGGKTWIVDGEPEGEVKRSARATAEAAAALLDAMRPGVHVSQLQARGREVYRRSGLAGADDVLVFFHGLGLSHMDLEQFTAEGRPNSDWVLEAGMVVPLHLLYPGGERGRMWLEEVALVTADGAEPFFSWGFDPICT